MATDIQETSNSQQGPQGQGPSRSKLVQRLLGASTDLPQFINDLLGTMAVVVAGTEAAGFLLERDPENPERMSLRAIAHIRPDESDADTRAAAIKAFQEILVPCIQQNKDGAIEVGSPDAGEPQFCLVTLLRTEGAVVAAAAVITRCRDQERARQRLMSMQLVAGYFELYTMRRKAEQAQTLAQDQQNVLQLASAVGTAEGFESAAMNLCNELSNRTGATRVAVGWVKGRNVKVKALSHTEKFDKKQELIVQIQHAMEECVDQEEPVRFGADGERSDNVTRSAEVLSRQQGGNTVLSLPLRGKDEVWGVVTLEWASPYKLTPQTCDALIVASGVLSPQLYDRHENDRWIAVKIGLSIRNNAKMVIGPKHMLVKLIFVLVVALGIFVGTFKPMYHVSAPFTLAANGRQSLSAPFDGQIKSIPVKIGAVVTMDQVLLVMDTRDLEIRQFKARSEYESHMREYRKDVADPTKTADAGIALKQADSAKADLELFTRQIAQASIRAPFDGVILKGDLEDRIGSTVKEGEPFFEIAPLVSLRAELSVSERDIKELIDPAKIKPNEIDPVTGQLRKPQTGHLSSSSFPSQSFPFTVERIIPLPKPAEGDNAFTVYVKLDEKANWMHPGMAGEAKIDIEHRRVAWIWTHRLVDYLRLKLWF